MDKIKHTKAGLLLQRPAFFYVYTLSSFSYYDENHQTSLLKIFLL